MDSIIFLCISQNSKIDFKTLLLNFCYNRSRNKWSTYSIETGDAYEKRDKSTERKYFEKMLQLIYVLTIVFAALVYLMWQLNRLIKELRKTIDALTDLIKSVNKLKNQLKKFSKCKK